MCSGTCDACALQRVLPRQSSLCDWRIVEPSAVVRCKTTDERADLLTKAMGKDNASYKLFRDDIMNVRSVA